MLAQKEKKCFNRDYLPIINFTCKSKMYIFTQETEFSWWTSNYWLLLHV